MEIIVVDLSDLPDFKKYPLLGGDINILFATDYYDRDLNGMCEYAKEEYYFHWMDADDESADHYLMVKLDPLYSAILWAKQLLLQKHVESGFLYDDKMPELKSYPKNGLEKYKEFEKALENLDDCEFWKEIKDEDIVGRFTYRNICHATCRFSH